MSGMVGTVKSLTGTVRAVMEDGSVATLVVEDQIRNMEKIVVEPGGSAHVALLNGKMITLKGGEELVLDESVTGKDAFAAEDTQIDVEGMQQALMDGDLPMDDTATERRDSNETEENDNSSFTADDKDSTIFDNEPPEVSDKLVDDFGNDDIQFANGPQTTFTLEDYDEGGARDTKDDANPALVTSVKIESLPEHGNLYADMDGDSNPEQLQIGDVLADDTEITYVMTMGVCDEDDKDSFTYSAVDSDGAASVAPVEATVTFDISDFSINCDIA